MNEIIFNCLSTSVSSLLRNVRNTLSKMLESSEKNELLLKENLLCEDYCFMDYDGKAYSFAGFKKGEYGIDLVGYEIFSDGRPQSKEKVFVPAWNYPNIILLEMVQNFNDAIEKETENN